MRNFLFVAALSLFATSVSIPRSQAGEFVLRYPYQPAPTMTAEQTETALVRRFGIGSKERAFRVDAPAYVRQYSDEEKSAQRTSGQKIVEQLCRAAAQGNAEFTIPPGIFRVKDGSFNLKDVHDFTVHCVGVEFITEDSAASPLRVFSFERCRNVAIIGPATWDAETLAYSEGKIVAVDPVADTYDLDILDGYPLLKPEMHGRVQYFDPQGHILSWAQMGYKKIEPLGDRRFRVVLGREDWTHSQGITSQARVGNLVALEETGGSFVQWNDSENMSVEGITCYAGCCHMIESGTRGYSLSKDCRAIPRPGTNRLVGGQPGQYNLKSGVLVYDGCDFEVGWDDGINLLSGFGMVSHQTGPRELLVLKHGFDFDLGKTLTFYDFDRFDVLATAKVASAAEVKDEAAQAEIAAVCKAARLRAHEGAIYKVTLDRDVAVTPHAWVESSQDRADEVIVRNSYWADLDAQDLLLQGARKGLVENNLFDRGAGPALHMGSSCYWWEGPVPSDFVVRNNVCRDNPVYLPTPRGTAGSLCVVPGVSHPTDAAVIHHILVEGNRIVRPSCSGIFVENSDDVRIINNTIIDPMPRPLIGEAGKTILADSAAIWLRETTDAEISGNTIDLRHSLCHEAIHIEPDAAAGKVKVANNRIIAPPTDQLTR